MIAHSTTRLLRAPLMAPLLAGTLLLAAAAPALAAPAHDVRAFSVADANALLDTPVEEQAGPVTCAKGEILLDNGTCAATRAFSIAKMGNKSEPAQLTTRPAQPRAQLAPSSRPATPVGARRINPAADVPLQFAVGSAVLSPGSRANLATLAKALGSAQHQGKRVRIVGHTDRSGTQQANLTLSQRRADAVAEYLASQGVDKSRIETLGLADTVMIPGVSPFSPRQRRVEITRVQ